ncbi:citrate synthase [Verrucomicrobiaceae bacterium R5-34]|uniref:Citrate synthase n=1 Tax=Oceaniferula flava TaxID=2800421 RepID=A0AAE2SEQ5_9BACT|nr:citrate/2-methylcitrate synthase [Oceaniferula flavus]MBK1831048.1 citrate synthase [Verrucomicrobiaceae bacterium R5-34]MBK1855564.1 citrate synthase [Oceaniferula flavus]MBM1136870.1 citrate synthase [Oceaniferula flavus]
MSDYAKGLEGVIANESALSRVEGLEGKLSYLGYDIDDLVNGCTFEEVTYLLQNGQLPNQSELDAFCESLRGRRELPQGVVDFLKSAPKDALPMDIIRTGVSMLGLTDKRAKIGEPDHEANREVALSIVAQIPVIVAYYHRARQGMDLPPVRTDLGEAAHFLYLINGEEPSEAMARTLDIAYIIHADHGMNASTFSARVTVATLSDMYSAVTSAIGTLKGPLHGGANEGVIQMLEEIGEEDKVDAYVEDCLTNKKKIMGIGHRVYKVLDPRAPHLQKMAIKLTEELGEPKWINMSNRIAEIMRERKGLNANVDFYSATVYYSMGIPTDLFTPIFAIARAAGWTAQVLEQLQDNRLYRPLTKYVGPQETMPVPPISER